MAQLSLTQRLRILFSGQLPEQPAQPVLPPTRRVVGTYNGMTLVDWVQSDERIKYAQELFRQPFFRDLLAVLSNARPQPKQPFDAVREFGRREGFDDLLRVLLVLPKFPEQNAPEVEADYGATIEADEEAE